MRPRARWRPAPSPVSRFWPTERHASPSSCQAPRPRTTPRPPRARSPMCARGVHVAIARNNTNPLVTVHFNTPVTQAHLSLRTARTRTVCGRASRQRPAPVVTMDATKDGGAMLKIEFAKGDYLPADAPAAPPSDGAQAPPPRRPRHHGPVQGGHLPPSQLPPPADATPARCARQRLPAPAATRTLAILRIRGCLRLRDVPARPGLRTPGPRPAPPSAEPFPSRSAPTRSGSTPGRGRSTRAAMCKSTSRPFI